MWKKVEESIVLPEGDLAKLCSPCDGYNYNCYYYSDKKIELIKPEDRIRTGLERFLHKYPYWNKLDIQHVKTRFNHGLDIIY